jgi:hypothetical protein
MAKRKIIAIKIILKIKPKKAFMLHRVKKSRPFTQRTAIQLNCNKPEIG